MLVRRLMVVELFLELFRTVVELVLELLYFKRLTLLQDAFTQRQTFLLSRHLGNLSQKSHFVRIICNNSFNLNENAS